MSKRTITAVIDHAMSYGGKNTFGTNLNCAYLQSAFKTCLVFYVFFFSSRR